MKKERLTIYNLPEGTIEKLKQKAKKEGFFNVQRKT